MSKFFERTSLPVLLVALASTFPTCAVANNGMYLCGYGTESLLMGGADVAVARDAFASTNNPAGMTQLTGQAADVELVIFDGISATHTDSFGNYRKPVTNGFGAYGSGAYARRFDHSPYAAGVGLIVQGGLGWVYSGLNTRFGTRDDASSLFTILKLAPAFAWQASDQLSLGVSLGINYIGGSQELFPNTSDAASGFSGFRFTGASGTGLNSKWGLQYRPAKDVTIGVTYGTQTSVPMKGGILRINYTNTIPGQGVVRYDNARLSGFRLPEELALGVSFRPTPPLLISLQEKWYNWSDAINKFQLTATNPRASGVPPAVPIASTADFSDQHVIAIGLAYDYDQDTVLMAGVNHGSSPIPDQNINPIFAPIQSRHYMFGVSRKIAPEWRMAAGVQLFPLQSATYDNPIFGQRANEQHSALLLHISLGRRW